jgi:glycosyltransferase involved in cell wall biosynthesis
MTLSIAMITMNEEANLPRTLNSVRFADEIVIVDSFSTDRTLEIARSYNAKVFVEAFKGHGGQKNSAIDKCTSDWILLLDADEVLSAPLQQHHLTMPTGSTAATRSSAAGCATAASTPTASYASSVAAPHA